MSRLWSDLVLAYKVLFGVICINNNTLFMLRNQPHQHGRIYTDESHHETTMFYLSYTKFFLV